uniref:Variant surface glycoprotein (VSG), putative n=1 Tax=Trypanosoma brucei brucei (strain 927/4 GUTat10.1) TaxID=185431 RepID=Q4FKU5_TRYB2|nr:variant surface glycoprotein (VSG), putative [Trypanosoma brucei brucei TREU927]
MVKKAETVTAALLLSLSTVADAATSDGANQAIFPALCSVLRIADGKITVNPPTESAATPPTQLFNLNMSLAPKEWRARFLTSGDGGKPTPKEMPKTELIVDWQAKWTTWAAAAAVTADPEQEKKLRAEMGLDGATTAQLNAIRPEIAAIADAAFDLLNTQTGQGEPIKTDEQIATDIRTAIYGQDKVPAAAGDVAAIFTGNPTTAQAACENGGPAPATQSFMGAVACVCIGANGCADKLCNQKGSALTWESGAQPTIATIQAVRNFCPANEFTTLSAQELRTALTAASSLVFGSGSDAYIGQHDGTCDGSNTAACIKYAGAASSGKPNLAKIPWHKALADIAAEIDRRTDSNRLKQQVKTEISRAEKMAAKIASHATKRQTTAEETSSVAKGQGSVNQKTKETECNAAADDQKKCKELEGKGCTYDEAKEKGKKCTLSDEAKQAAEKKAKETEGKDGKAASDRCIKHTKKEDCKA